MTEEEAYALRLQSVAATKLAQTTLEFAINMARLQGLSLDLEGAAQAHLNCELNHSLDPKSLAIEGDARMIVAETLLAFARKSGC
ncbi:hypothetical protein AYR46_14535 [Sphingobium yanoikuyae]|jgi:hypothetical protein|uniref:Uncharacterized protein n=1 Tax=Sphingobium yanoikuyae TaxID=13690 RepID=A0A291N5Q3_SPHYA|nr:MULTISPECIES: hypothetical protein [Sphingobium]ATI82565.1 hypothetical protein A6768_22870 [Sphingobium yanoikuyae]KZC79092.1 hypothetical protein AYR46_14535 [Sphingobium yanoikuyae]PZU65372.1 MAG: hypothetical protein DI540_17230 [Sphingobium sp.]SHM65497.1 hypothetical protein SAMN05518668_11561 [Sphingobium sp. YR657]